MRLRGEVELLKDLLCSKTLDNFGTGCSIHISNHHLGSAAEQVLGDAEPDSSCSAWWGGQESELAQKQCTATGRTGDDSDLP